MTSRITVRLTARDHEQLEAITSSLAVPHRSPLTTTEVIRAAISAAAEHLSRSGLPR